MSAVDEEICQIDVELVLYDVMDIICKYLNGKDLANMAKVCKSWNHAVIREKNKRYCMQQLRLPYKTENLASVVGVIPAVSLLIYDITLENLLSLPITTGLDLDWGSIRHSNGLEGELLEDFEKQLPNKTIVLFITEYFTTENAKFLNTAEHHELELTASNGDILGLFIQSVERRVNIHVAWYEELWNYSKLTEGEIVNRLTKELGLNDCEYSKSTILLLSTTDTCNGIVSGVGKRAQQNGKEITFARIVLLKVGVGNSNSKIDTFMKTNVLLRISGPTVESWSTFIHQSAQTDEIECKLLKLKEKVKRKRYNIGLFYAPTCLVEECDHIEHPCGNKHEMMRYLIRFFPDIPFTGFIAYSQMHFLDDVGDPDFPDVFDEDDIFKQDFVNLLEIYLSIIIISYD